MQGRSKAMYDCLGGSVHQTVAAQSPDQKSKPRPRGNEGLQTTRKKLRQAHAEWNEAYCEVHQLEEELRHLNYTRNIDECLAIADNLGEFKTLVKNRDYEMNNLDEDIYCLYNEKRYKTRDAAIRLNTEYKDLYPLEAELDLLVKKNNSDDEAEIKELKRQINMLHDQIEVNIDKYHQQLGNLGESFLLYKRNGFTHGLNSSEEYFYLMTCIFPKNED